MAKEFKINWMGNYGYSTPAPGTREAVECGACGAQMNVERDVLGATSSIESMCGGKHRHDMFECPNLSEDWHKRIVRLKKDVCNEELRHDDPIGNEQKKKLAEKEILNLIKANIK